MSCDSQRVVLDWSALTRAIWKTHNMSECVKLTGLMYIPNMSFITGDLWTEIKHYHGFLLTDWKFWIWKYLNWFMLTYFWLRYCKTGTKKVQLVLQYCSKKSWKAMLRVLPPTFKPHSVATNQIVAGCEKLFQKVKSSSTFCICLCARFTGQRQNCFAASNVRLCMSWLPHVQTEVNI